MPRQGQFLGVGRLAGGAGRSASDAGEAVTCDDLRIQAAVMRVSDAKTRKNSLRVFMGIGVRTAKVMLGR